MTFKLKKKYEWVEWEKTLVMNERIRIKIGIIFNI